MALIAFQMQPNNLNAEEKKIIDEEELPAMDPFLGSSNFYEVDMNNKIESNDG